MLRFVHQLLPVEATRNLVRSVSSQKFGQPHPSTHTHLLKDDEVNVGITKSEFIARRENLASRILENLGRNKNTLVILPSTRKKFMIDHIPYFFRQDTDFRYLTGCLQPETVLVLEITKDSCRSILFMKANTKYEEKWEGPRFGFREAIDFFGVDDVLSSQTLQDYLYRYSCDNTNFNICYDMVDPRDLETDKTVQSFIASIDRSNFQTIQSLRDEIHQLRSVKSEPEIELMRQTCRIGATALKRTMAASRSLVAEQQFLATVDYESRMQGADHLAYPPVVAAGNNANTIHYIAATGRVNPGDLILMDAGCEYHGYSSDITRTWPIAGHFSDAQKILYQLVLDCQQSLISSIAPGETSINTLYKHMQLHLANSLRSAGLISPSLDDVTATRFAHQFCPHNVGHHLGMDVHDCGSVSKSQPLVAGNVITIEPGIYINQHDPSVPAEFRGIGIRVEDDILINQSGCENLSSGCPKSIQEIQDLVLNKV